MQTTTKPAKTTKKLRKAIIMEAILNGTFNRQKLTEQFHCSDRAFRTDMNELATALEQPIENQVTMLRAICAERLSTLAAKKKLDPNIMAKIVVAGFARRLEVKEEITVTEKVMCATIDLTKLADNERKAILEAEEALTRAENTVSEE